MQLTEAIRVGFNIEEGPCIKSIKSSLTSLGVCCQRYYGGIFVGNHVHNILKVYGCAMLCGPDIYSLHAYIKTFCSFVPKITENSPELKLEAEAVGHKFNTILMQFSECQFFMTVQY